MDEARQLLSKEANTNPASGNMCKILDDLMKKMPVISVRRISVSYTVLLEYCNYLQWCVHKDGF